MGVCNRWAGIWTRMVEWTMELLENMQTHISVTIPSSVVKLFNSTILGHIPVQQLDTPIDYGPLRLGYWHTHKGKSLTVEARANVMLIESLHRANWRYYCRSPHCRYTGDSADCSGCVPCIPEVLEGTWRCGMDLIGNWSHFEMTGTNDVWWVTCTLSSGVLSGIHVLVPSTVHWCPSYILLEKCTYTQSLPLCIFHWYPLLEPTQCMFVKLASISL